MWSKEVKDFTEAYRERSESKYQRFLDEHPESAIAGEVRENLDLLSFSHAESMGSSYGYDSYLREHPEGKYAEQARERIDHIRTRMDRIRNAMPVNVRHLQCITVIEEEHYGQVKELTLNLGLELRLLKEMGISPHTKFDRPCNPSDAVLTIVANGRVTGARYRYTRRSGERIEESKVGFYNTGANISGRLIFDVPGVARFTKSFDGHLDMPTRFEGIEPPTSQAQLASLILEAGSQSSFKERLIELLVDVFGYDSVAIVLEEGLWLKEPAILKKLSTKKTQPKGK